MRLVERVVHRFDGPLVVRIGRRTVTLDFYPVALARGGLVAAAVQGDDHQRRFVLPVLHPAHPVNGRLVRQLDRLPLFRPVGGRDEIEHRAAVHRVAGIPAGADRDLGLAVAVDVCCGDANVIKLGEIFGDDVLLPRRVLIPDNLFGVTQHDVGPFVAVHVRHRDAVADDDVGVDIHRAERQRWRGEAWNSNQPRETGEAEKRFDLHSRRSVCGVTLTSGWNLGKRKLRWNSGA